MRVKCICTYRHNSTSEKPILLLRSILIKCH